MWPVTSPALQCLLLCVAVGGRSVAVDAQGDRERRLRARSPEAARLETEMFEKRFELVNQKTPTWGLDVANYVVLLRVPGSGATELTKFVDVVSHGCNCDQSFCACRSQDAGQFCADLKCVQHCANSGCHKMWSHAPMADWIEIHGAFLRAEIPRDQVVLMTMLRDPVQRVLNEYLWVRQKASNDCATDPDEGRRYAWDYSISCHAKIAAFLADEGVRSHAFNRQTKMLAGVSDFEASELYDSPEEMLQVAKKHLAQMPWFGLGERVRESVKMLQDLHDDLGIKVEITGDLQKESEAMAQKGGDRVSLLPAVDTKLVDVIKAGNALDVELYAYAEKLFEQRLRKAGSDASILIPQIGLGPDTGVALATCVSGLCTKDPLESYMARRPWDAAAAAGGSAIPEDVRFGEMFDKEFRAERQECDIDEETLGTFAWYNSNGGCIFDYNWYHSNAYEVPGKVPYFFSTRSMYPFENLQKGNYVLAVGDAATMGVYASQSYLAHVEHRLSMPVVSVAFGNVGAAFYIDLHQKRRKTVMGRTFRNLLVGARVIILQTMRVEAERNSACQTRCNTRTCEDGLAFRDKLDALSGEERNRSLAESQRSWQANHVRLLSILTDNRKTANIRDVVVLHFASLSGAQYVTEEMLNEVRSKLPTDRKGVRTYFVSASLAEPHRQDKIPIDATSCMKHKKRCPRRSPNSCGPSEVNDNCQCGFLDIAEYPCPALHWVAGTRIVAKLLAGTPQMMLRPLSAIGKPPKASGESSRMQFFMLLTKGVATLEDRTPLVTVETACRNHPGAAFFIYVLRDAGVQIEPAFLSVISGGGCRVELLTLDYDAFFRGSPLEGFVTGQRDVLRGGKFWYSHATDLFRTIVLWRFGGWYLDTDVLILRSLQGLSNCAAWEDPIRAIINSAVSTFDRGHPLLKSIMVYITKKYSPTAWDVAGPGALTAVIVGWPHRNCDDADCVHVLPRKTFYPVSTVEPIFAPVSDDVAQGFLEGAYSIHLWNKLTRKQTAQKGSIFFRAYGENCLNCSLLHG